MLGVIQPVLRQSLADDLAQRIKELIDRRAYQTGDRLPSIAEMARHFRVGSPTLREALKKLETVGVVAIRHGAGVFVGDRRDSLLVSNPVLHAAPSKKLLVDLIEARIPIELKSASLAALNATDDDLQQMRALLSHADANLEVASVLNQANLGFHRQIALASGNTVIGQLLDVISSLFREQQRQILDIHGSRRQDHVEHLGILEALERHDQALAVERMHAHLNGVRDVLLRWDPSATPVA